VRLTIKGGLHFFFSLSKCLDDAQSFLGYVLLTKSSFRIILSSLPQHVHIRHRREYDEQKAVVVG